MKVRLDNIDRKLIVLLQKNCRLTFTELARRVHLSSPAVSERVRQLEESGVIRGYHADIDPVTVGFPVVANIRLAVRSGDQCRQLLAALKKIPEVVEAFRVTGPDSAVVTALASSTEHLEDLIDRIGAIGKPTTSIVTSFFRRVPAVGVFEEQQDASCQGTFKSVKHQSDA